MLGTNLGIPFIRCYSFMVFSLHIWAISQQVINQSISLIHPYISIQMESLGTYNMQAKTKGCLKDKTGELHLKNK